MSSSRDEAGNGDAAEDQVDSSNRKMSANDDGMISAKERLARLCPSLAEIFFTRSLKSVLYYKKKNVSSKYLRFSMILSKYIFAVLKKSCNSE